MVAALAVWLERAASDPQGEENSSCYKRELEPIPNSAGMVASAHNTVCGDMGGNSAIYVYVHRASENERRSDLIFAYSDRGNWELPTIEWKNANLLTIRVKHVVQVTKRVSSMGSVRVEYEIDQEDYPALTN